MSIIWAAAAFDFQVNSPNSTTRQATSMGEYGFPLGRLTSKSIEMLPMNTTIEIQRRRSATLKILIQACLPTVDSFTDSDLRLTLLNEPRLPHCHPYSKNQGRAKQSEKHRLRRLESELISHKAVRQKTDRAPGREEHVESENIKHAILMNVD